MLYVVIHTYRGMQAQVLAASEPQACEASFLLSLLIRLRMLYSICHKALELGKCLLDFGYSPRAVNQLSLRWVKLAGAVRRLGHGVELVLTC